MFMVPNPGVSVAHAAFAIPKEEVFAIISFPPLVILMVPLHTADAPIVKTPLTVNCDPLLKARVPFPAAGEAVEPKVRVVQEYVPSTFSVAPFLTVTTSPAASGTPAPPMVEQNVAVVIV